MDKFKAGVIGATGMVGQRFVTLISRHPWFELSVRGGKRPQRRQDLRGGSRQPLGPSTSRCPSARSSCVLRDASDVESVAADVDFVFSAVDMKAEEIRALEEEYAGQL